MAEPPSEEVLYLLICGLLICDNPGLWVNESESKHQWMQIFDEIKNRGAENVLFIYMDGVRNCKEQTISR